MNKSEIKELIAKNTALAIEKHIETLSRDIMNNLNTAYDKNGNVDIVALAISAITPTIQLSVVTTIKTLQDLGLVSEYQETE